jgi:hypothetical protein
MEAAMVDAKVRYLVFFLFVVVGVFLPAAAAIRAPFLWFGLGGLSDELHLSQKKDRQIILREIEKSARKVQHERDLEILREIGREIEKDLPADSDDAIM